MQIDVIMQGPIHLGTLQYAQDYLQRPLINRVIISTWVGEKQYVVDPRITMLFNVDPTNPGQNNRNRQIVSTKEGLELVTAPITVKTRTDQFIRPNSWDIMFNFFVGNYPIEYKFLDGTGPKGAIFTVGLYTAFPFHPQDHLFYGFTEDIKTLFSLPLDSKYPANMANPADNSGASLDFAHNDTRPNAYIGMHYYAKFDKRIAEMVKDYKRFIVDAAPEKAEAMELDRKYRDHIFKAFPTLDIWWEKYNTNYPYAWGIPYTEYHS